MLADAAEMISFAGIPDEDLRRRPERGSEAIDLNSVTSKANSNSTNLEQAERAEQSQHEHTGHTAGT